MRSDITAFAMLPLLLTMGMTTAIADEPAAQPQRLTCRLLGMFSADREKNLKKAFEELPAIKLLNINFADAEITVEVIPKQAFADTKPDRWIEQFDQKLRSASHHTFGVKPRSTLAKDKLEEIVIAARGLDCQACCLAAYEAIASIDGVEQATVSFKESHVTARIDPSKTNRAKLEAALKQKGVELGK